MASLVRGIRVAIAALTLPLLAEYALAASNPAEAPAASSGPSVSHDVKHDISPSLRDLAASMPSAPRVIPSALPVRKTPPPPPSSTNSAAPESALQSSPGPLLDTTSGLNFDGIGADGPSPPDTNGSVGDTQYVHMVNEQYAVYDKTSGALIFGPVAINTLWSGFGTLCETNNGGDPVVLWDKGAKRWFISQLAYTGGFSSNFQCIAISTTSDATGSFARYAFDDGANLPDYPKYGVWPDAYYGSTNTFPNGGAFTGAQACAFDRTAMLSGNPATKVCFQKDSSVASLLPSDLDGTVAPPAGAPDTFAYLADSSTVGLFKFHVDFATPANSTFTGPTSIPVASYSQACGGGTCVPQLGTTTTLDSLGDRMMYRLAYRNFGDHEALVATHSVAAGGSTGVRWYEIRNPNGTPALYQQGTFAPDATYRWMGSIAMDQAGDIAVGFSASSSSIHPAVRYSGRSPSDPLGTLGSENSIIEGTGSQNGGLSRWGDYSSMSVDPQDDCTFWYTNEYYPTDGSGSWHTRVGSFKFNACGGPAGTVHFDQRTYACASQITLHVIDSNVGGPTVTVTVTSSTETTPETVTLTQIAPGSARYDGSIPATSGPAVAGDGLLSIQNGDTLTVQYVDADDGAGNHNVTRTDTAQGDCVPPVITQVATTGISDVQATVTWATDEVASSVVNWGPLKPPANTASTFGFAAAHSVLLTGLQQCTTYWYSVSSQDPAGNATLDDFAGQYYHFETLGNFGNGGLQGCHAGRLTLGKTTVNCTDTLSITVTDIDLNLSPTAVDTAVATVTSTTQGTPITVTLTETGANTSIFTGSIVMTTGPTTPGDGHIQIKDGDVVTATYHDANDGTGAAAVSFADATVDCSGPVGSSINLSPIQDDQATLSWTTSEPSTGQVDWGTTPSLGNTVIDGTLTTNHSVLLQPLAECGRAYFRITVTDAYGNSRVLDVSGTPYAFNADRIPPGIFKETFENATGWTLSGEFQIGAPQGKGTYPPDPASAFEGSKVLGDDLTGTGANPGNYEPGVLDKATSPSINASTLQNGQLRFRRWLNVNGDNALSSIVISRNGVLFTVWSSASVGDAAWSLQTVNVSQYVDGVANVKIIFQQKGSTTAGGTRSGWNVDRLILNSANQPAFEACGSCGGAPTFGGIASASDPNPCGDTGLALSWNAAPAWGTGSGGTYTVYRDVVPNFTPSAGNLLAKGVTGTSYTDTTAVVGTSYYYLVRAENNETCSTGANNHGVTDANLVYASAKNTSSQPAPGAVGSTLASNPENAAHVRLTWGAAANAASYHVYRSQTPQGPFTEIANVAGTLYDDLDQLGNANPWYYVVKASDACGNEGP